MTQRRTGKGRRGPGCCLGTSRGSVLGSASQGLTPSSSRDLQAHVQTSLPREARLELREQGFPQWLLTGAWTLPAWAAACQPSRLSARKHVFSISHTVCANRLVRLVQQNVVPQVSKVGLSDGHLGNLAKSSSQKPAVDPPHKQAVLSQGCHGNSFPHRAAGRIK